MKKGFTLAEVLITLGIIGVVAAMTLPSVVGNYKKKVTVTRLKKFYSTMQQVIQLSEKDYGDIAYWMPPQEAVRNSSEFGKWFDKYLSKSFKILSEKPYSSSAKEYEVALADGSGFLAYASGTATVHFFYCTELRYCAPERYDGQTSFLFTITKVNNKFKFITSHGPDQNKTREQLLEQCKYGNFDNADVSISDKRHACARLIEYDGWEIKDDYPWKQTMLEPKN